MSYISYSDIQNIGKEYDYNWKDMAEKIIQLLGQIEDLEKQVNDLEKELAKKESE